MKSKSLFSWVNKGVVLFPTLMALSNVFAQEPGIWDTYGPTLLRPDVTVLLVDTMSEIIYAGTDGGVYRSLNFGLTWEQPNKLWRGQTVRHLILADSILYTEVENKIFKITDNGETWIELLSLGGLGYTDIFLLQYIEGIIFVASFHEFRGSARYSLISRKESGLSWQDAGAPFEGYHKITALEAINGTLCAGVTQTHPVSGIPIQAQGIYYSKDGVRWDKAITPKADENITKIIFADGKLYANTSSEILVSTDGINWAQDHTALGNTQLTTIIKSIDGSLFAGTTSSGILRSTNGGTSWEQVDSDSLNDKQVTTIIQVDNNNLYAGTKNAGVFRSTDGGRKWAHPGSPMNDKQVLSMVSLKRSIFAATGIDGIFRTTDGENWFDINREFQINVGCKRLVVDLNYVIAYYYDRGYRSYKVYLSKDGGLSWVEASDTLITASRITTMINAGGTVYAGTINNGILISTDGGENWRKVGAPINDSEVNRLFFVDGVLYAEVRGSQNGAFFSVDNGSTWVKTNSPLDARSLTTMFSLRGTHFAGTDRGLFRSVGDRTNWSLSADIPDIRVNSIVAIADTLYTSAGGSVFRSTDNGQGWSKRNDPVISDSLYNARVYVLFSVNNILFAGVFLVSPGGYYFDYALYQSLDGGLHWINATDPLSKAYVNPVINVGDFLYIAAYEVTKRGTIEGEHSKFLGVYRSKDGRNWYPLNLGLEDIVGLEKFKDEVDSDFLGLNQFAYIADLNHLYAATNNGVYFQKLDTASPLIEYFTIYDGRPFTTKPDVSVTLRASEADFMRIAEDSTFANIPWQLYRETLNFTLLNIDGPKFVYAQFRDKSWNISNTFSSIFLDTQKPVFPSSSPQLSPVTPAINQAVTVTLERPTDSNGSGIRSFELFYRQAGDNNQNKSPFVGNSAEILSQVVNNRGMDYFIKAVDSAGNSSLLPNDNPSFFSIQVAVGPRKADSSVALPSGTKASEYRLASMPLMVDNKSATDVFTDLDEYGAEKDYRFWRYEGKNGFQEGAQIPIQLGECYFLIKRRGGFLSNRIAGLTAKTTDAVLGNIAGWQLREKDWTFIGNLFNFEIDLKDLRLKNRGVSLDSIRNVWAYVGGWRSQPRRLEPWTGIVIGNDREADVIIYTPPSFDTNFSTTQLIRASEGNKGNGVATRSLSEGEWVLSVWAESQVAQDHENYFGVRTGAKDGRDEFDLYEPPLVPGGLSLSFGASGDQPKWNLSTDIRPTGEKGYEWTLQITGSGGSRVKLNFEELAMLPMDREIYLLDHSGRLMHDLRKQQEIEVYLPQSTRSKTLTVLVGDKMFVEGHSDGLRAVPSSFALRQNYPNPFNPTTVIRYALPVVSKVSLKIYDLLGKELITLENEKNREPGFYEAIVDLSGFASGIYFYRLSVSGEERFQAVKKMVFAK